MSQAKEAISKSPSGRVRRKAVDKQSRLAVEGKDPNFVYRWVNDDPGRIDDFQARGYTLVPADEVKVADRRVDVASSGSSLASLVVDKQTGRKSFLMKQRKEDFLEDQALKQKEVDELESTMYRDARNKSDYGELRSEPGFARSRN